MGESREEDDLRALVPLGDGRQVWRDGKGRYRDKKTGRFVPKRGVEDEARIPQQGKKRGTNGEEVKGAMGEERDPDTSIQAGQEEAREHLLETVRREGLDAEDASEAWGKLVGVQAEIALDKDAGSRATAAAKFVAQATGMLRDQLAGETEGVRIEMNSEVASRMIEAIRREREQRAKGEAATT